MTRLPPAAFLCLAACATAPPVGYPVYYGMAYGVGGTGGNVLDPWLTTTPEGRRLVLARFDRNGNGEIGTERAAEANAWFRRFADRDHDGRLTDQEIRAGLRRVGGALRP